MNNDQQVLAITKALAFTENGGQPSVANTKAGKTGEMKSIFQFEPGTWDAYSEQILGKKSPMTPENESVVTLGKVSKWYDQLKQEGHSEQEIPKMIASMWNAGPGEPNAYTGKFSDGSSSSGVNRKYGVKYDVPGYVNNFTKYFDKIQGASQAQTEQTQIGATGESTPTTMVPQLNQPMQQASPVPQPTETPATPTAVPPTKNSGLVPNMVNNKLGSSSNLSSNSLKSPSQYVPNTSKKKKRHSTNG